jgi:hypothetical protein
MTRPQCKKKVQKEMKDDNLRRRKETYGKKRGTQGRDIGDTQWRACIRRIRKKI